MRTVSRLRALLLLAATAACILRHDAVAARPQEPGASSQSAVEARIARVEHGLLPQVIIKGRPQPGMKLADRMAFYNVRGVSIAVINNGRVEWARGYGLADVSENRAVTSKTRFQAASISKPVTAAATLHFVQLGKLDLDRDVNDDLKSWKVPENEFTEKQTVTLRRILSHSAGLNVHGFAGYAEGKPVPTLVQVLNGEPPANSAPIRVILPPGSQFRYSGGGYTVLQQLLIDVLHEPFPRLMQQTVLSKLGMTSSDYSQPLRDDWRSAASGYQADGTPLAGKYHTYPELAAAGLWTTSSDLARFAIGIQEAVAGKSHAVISQKMAEQMLTGQVDHVGLGLALDGSGQALRFSHSGGNAGFQCLLVAYAHTGQGAVIMTNSDRGGELITEIMFGIAHEYHWANYAPEERAVAKIDTSVYADYVGHYAVSQGGVVITISTLNHRLFAQAIHEPEYELFPESPTRFFALVKDNEVEFKRGASGKVEVMEIHQAGQSFPAKRMQ